MCWGFYEQHLKAASRKGFNHRPRLVTWPKLHVTWLTFHPRHFAMWEKERKSTFLLLTNKTKPVLCVEDKERRAFPCQWVRLRSNCNHELLRHTLTKTIIKTPLYLHVWITASAVRDSCVRGRACVYVRRPNSAAFNSNVIERLF